MQQGCVCVHACGNIHSQFSFWSQLVWKIRVNLKLWSTFRVEQTALNISVDIRY